jgi:hypothetical protein
MNRLDKRQSKVTRLLNYMLDAKNDVKVLQCLYIQTLILQIRKRDAEMQEKKYNELLTKRQNYLVNL